MTLPFLTALCTSSGAPTIAPTVWRGFSDEYGSWKISWISRRYGSMSRRLRCPISWPSNLMLPAVGS